MPDEQMHAPSPVPTASPRSQPGPSSHIIVSPYVPAPVLTASPCARLQFPQEAHGPSTSSHSKLLGPNSQIPQQGPVPRPQFSQQAVVPRPHFKPLGTGPIFAPLPQIPQQAPGSRSQFSQPSPRPWAPRLQFPQQALALIPKSHSNPRP